MTLPRTAGAVVIGGGSTGASIAYHLARRGLRDVVLLNTLHRIGVFERPANSSGGERPVTTTAT